jgi:parallel beta-helix repeat protein
MRNHVVRSALAALGIAAMVGAIALPASASGRASADQRPKVWVHHGESIQAAINKVPAGTTIVLQPGTYAQTFTLRKDDIRVQGSGPTEDGTILVPPSPLPDNFCTKSSGGSGVCVVGKLKHGQMVDPANKDTITGILFRGWPSMGVFAFGTTNLSITNNGSDGAGEYGFARFESSGGLIEKNWATGSEEAGIYVGDSANANAVVEGNDVSDNQLGIFIRHTRKVEVAYNHAQGNCEGVLVLDDGQPGGAGNINIHNNVFDANNKFCPAGDENPPLQGGGVLLFGATNSIVAQNQVLNNQGDQLNSGGIVLLSAGPEGGDPSGNIVRNNTAYSNSPADIIYDGSGSGNQFYGNHCATSQPDGLCIS